jgi:hypothetical protein
MCVTWLLRCACVCSSTGVYDVHGVYGVYRACWLLWQLRLLDMERVLCGGLVGQDEAISVMSRCIRLSRAGLRYHDRPLGVFLMIGPTVRAVCAVAIGYTRCKLQ